MPEKVKDAKEVVKMLKRCNELNAHYLLHVPQDRDGLISAHHLEGMRQVAELMQADQ